MNTIFTSKPSHDPSSGISTVKNSPLKSKLDTILTSTIASIPHDQQNACIWSWRGKAGRVLATGAIDLTPYDGLSVNSGGIATLAGVLTNYTMKIPGGEVFMIAAPDVDISGDQKPLFDWVRASGMEFMWGSHHGTHILPMAEPVSDMDPVAVPKAFILSASALPYLVRYIPSNLTLDGLGWAKWMHEHLANDMGASKYFDGSRFNLISPWKKS